MLCSPTDNTWKRLSGPAPWRPSIRMPIGMLIDVLIVGLALAAISVAAVRLARLRPFLLVGWCWYLGTLVPVIGIVQVGVQVAGRPLHLYSAHRHFHHRGLGRRGVRRGLAGQEQSPRGSDGVGPLRMVYLAAGGHLVQQRGPLQECRGNPAFQSLGTVWSRHGLLEGRKAGRGSATIRDRIEIAIRSASPWRPGAFPSGYGAVAGRATSTA